MFASVAIFAVLLTVPAAQAFETCLQMGNFSLFWGTTVQTTTTAKPMGWSTSASAPTDATGHGILAVRSTVSPTLWPAFACTEPAAGGGPPGKRAKRGNGGTTSGPTGGGGGGGPAGGGGNAGGGGGGGNNANVTSGPITFFGPVADPGTNLCLTVSFDDLNNMTVTRAGCIQTLDIVPHPTQAWQWTLVEDQGTVLPNELYSLVFIGTQSITALAANVSTNYVPTLVGTGVGAYVSLQQTVGGLNPSLAVTNPGLLVEFIPTIPTTPPPAPP
ncbi:hypothetical protein B0H16DRAFT_1759331 [Mycena metata]|uniref:Secreted protein n=1 Tax=Mycena metata TaxID=1033252 RepID=A0AAD7MZI3_9AGAR|nr:hypothetical protein B0H16DRAFT_1759331 [Mycena metata]